MNKDQHTNRLTNLEISKRISEYNRAQFSCGRSVISMMVGFRNSAYIVSYGLADGPTTVTRNKRE